MHDWRRPSNVFTVLIMAATGCAATTTATREQVGPTSSVALTASPSPAPWTGKVKAAPTKIPFDVSRTDAVRFEINMYAPPIESYLLSPGGQKVTPDSPGSGYDEVGSQAIYFIKDPEVGTWSLVLRSPSGWQQVLARAIPIDIPQDPVAKMQLTRIDAYTVSVTSEGSSDSDGRIAQYEWGFSDGTYVEGPSATHRYGAPGEYVVTLMVTDDQGLKGFAWSRVDVP
jgi:hypothetical protein